MKSQVDKHVNQTLQDSYKSKKNKKTNNPKFILKNIKKCKEWKIFTSTRNRSLKEKVHW